MHLYVLCKSAECSWSLGHCVSYDMIRRMDTPIARKKIDDLERNEYVPIPTNLDSRIGLKRVVIVRRDRDVLVLLIASFHSL